MDYWTFKHKPGTDGGNDAFKIVEEAKALNCVLMQYEYEHQKQDKVTLNWNRIKEVKEGDYIFLRGDKNIYAFGIAVKPRKKADIILNMQQIINDKSNGKYKSGDYDGCIHFNDSDVFYEDLYINKLDNWGQRIDVDYWRYFSDKGIYAKDIANYQVGENEFGVLKKLKNNKAKEFMQTLEEMELEKLLVQSKNLLNYKKQIILQGPPGTGKTKLAKELAKKLIGTKKEISPKEIIESYFANFEVNDKIIEHRKLVEKTNNEFLEKFKKENLKKLSLEEYALGSEEMDNFCYWIEYKGKYTGQANKGKIYWDSNAEEYKKSGFIKNIEDDEEAMKKIADVLDEIVSEKQENYPIGKGFVLKLLNTYHPEKYFPINSEKCLDNFLKLVNENDANLNYIEKNKKVQEYFIKQNAKYNNKLTNYEFMYFLFDNFDLKGEIQIQNEKVVVEGEYKLIQFHPSYTYEDFVRGIVAESKGDKIEYKNVNKILAEFADKALLNKSEKYILIIDEINRANLSSVLGELIYALEYRYYYKNPEEKQKEAEVESMYALKDENGGESRILKLPENLYIIGTMNTADRSVGHIDYAIRRRFAFVNVLPDGVKLKEKLGDDFKDTLFNKVKTLFTTDNFNTNSSHLSSEFHSKDVALGHSYFIQHYEKDEKGEDDKSKPIDFNLRLEYEIKPILMEYVKDGVLKETAIQVINDLKVE